MDMKNDRKDDKTRWELMPLDCLEDIARVYTEGAKKYNDNTWQNLENGYERYKGALLRHLYAAENEIFDEETGCRHLAQVAWNAIALLWISKHVVNGKLKTLEQIEHEKKVADFKQVLDNFEEVIKADSEANVQSKVYEYKWDDKQINKAVKKSGLSDVRISYCPILNWDKKTQDAKIRDGRYVYNLYAYRNKDNGIIESVLEFNLLKRHLLHFLDTYKENVSKKMSTLKSDSEKLDQILLNQQVILLYLNQILKDTNRSQFAEDYVANLAAQMTEIILGNNIVRK